jgi:hypothetical protein
MPEDINQPLESLSFSDLIGKPLLSCIAAQERASHAVWKYIEDVGLTEESDGNKEAVIVSFSFVSQGQEIRLSVPLLSIVPIPYFSIDSLDINFRANVTAVENDTLKATYSFSKDSSGCSGQRILRRECHRCESAGDTRQYACGTEQGDELP